MLAILVAMVVIVALAALVIGYVTFPHRGRDLLRAEWLTTAMARGGERFRAATPDRDEDRSGTAAGSR